MKRSRGRSLEAETEAEAMEESCLLAWSSWLVLPATSTGWHCPPVSWALPHQSIIKCLMGFLIGNLVEVFSQLRCISSDNSDLCQLEKKTNQEWCSILTLTVCYVIPILLHFPGSR